MDDTDPTPGNEITDLARSARATADRIAGTRDPSQRASDRERWPIGKIGLGIGIGSAAIAAALLYASKSRRK